MNTSGSRSCCVMDIAEKAILAHSFKMDTRNTDWHELKMSSK